MLRPSTLLVLLSSVLLVPLTLSLRFVGRGASGTKHSTQDDHAVYSAHLAAVWAVPALCLPLILRLEWRWCYQWFPPILAGYTMTVFLASWMSSTAAWAFLSKSLVSMWLLHFLDVTGSRAWLVSCMPTQADLAAILHSPAALATSGILLTTYALIFKLASEAYLDLAEFEGQELLQSSRDVMDHQHIAGGLVTGHAKTVLRTQTDLAEHQHCNKQATTVSPQLTVVNPQAYDMPFWDPALSNVGQAELDTWLADINASEDSDHAGAYYDYDDCFLNLLLIPSSPTPTHAIAPTTHPDADHGAVNADHIPVHADPMPSPASKVNKQTTSTVHNIGPSNLSIGATVTNTSTFSPAPTLQVPAQHASKHSGNPALVNSSILSASPILEPLMQHTSQTRNIDQVNDNTYTSSPTLPAPSQHGHSNLDTNASVNSLTFRPSSCLQAPLQQAGDVSADNSVLKSASVMKTLSIAAYNISSHPIFPLGAPQQGPPAKATAAETTQDNNDFDHKENNAALSHQSVSDDLETVDAQDSKAVDTIKPLHNVRAVGVQHNIATGQPVRRSSSLKETVKKGFTQVKASKKKLQAVTSAKARSLYRPSSSSSGPTDPATTPTTPTLKSTRRQSSLKRLGSAVHNALTPACTGLKMGSAIET